VDPDQLVSVRVTRTVVIGKVLCPALNAPGMPRAFVYLRTHVTSKGCSMRMASPDWGRGLVRRTGARLRPGFTSLLVAGLVLGLSGGGCDVLAPSESDFSFAGTWAADGTIQFRKSTWSPSQYETRTARLVLTFRPHSHINEDGIPLSGTWSMTYADPANNRSGSFSARASRGRQCSAGATTTICTNNDPFVNMIADIVLTSTSACSTLYVPAHIIVEDDKTILIVALKNGTNGTLTDATCGDLWRYDSLSWSTFMLTRK
jgi:hypothetical protein